MADTAYLTPAQYWSTFANWSPNTGSAYVAVSGTNPNVPKLAITNPNNLPNFNPAPVQVHQHVTARQQGW